MPPKPERSHWFEPRARARTSDRIRTNHRTRRAPEVSGERFVALGLARARSGWFSELARWSTSAAIPLEFVKCVTVEEVRARLASGRAFSALLVDGNLPAVDRDLVDDARSCGCAVVVVDDGRVERDWTLLGASAVLPTPFTRDELLDVLTTHAVPISRTDVMVARDDEHHAAGAWRGKALPGPRRGGTGAPAPTHGPPPRAAPPPP